MDKTILFWSIVLILFATAVFCAYAHPMACPLGVLLHNASFIKSIIMLFGLVSVFLFNFFSQEKKEKNKCKLWEEKEIISKLFDFFIGFLRKSAVSQIYDLDPIALS